MVGSDCERIYPTGTDRAGAELRQTGRRDQTPLTLTLPLQLHSLISPHVSETLET